MKIFYMLIFCKLLSKIILSPIIIPFKTYHYSDTTDTDFNPQNFIKYNFKNIIYTQLNIGTPPKSALFAITTQKHGLFLGYTFCSEYFYTPPSSGFSDYISNTSKSFSLLSNDEIKYAELNGCFLAKDTFEFYTNTNLNTKNNFNDIEFIYAPENSRNKKKDLLKDEVCGVIGLSIVGTIYYEKYKNLIYDLNVLNFTKNYVYSIKYFNDDEGQIVIGEEPHEYLKNDYKEINYLKTNALATDGSTFEWKTQFRQIYFFVNNEKILITEKTLGKFELSNNYIIGSSAYKNKIEEYFFNKYLNEKICNYENIERNIMLICDKKNFDYKNFPSLYFYHRIFNYTFEIDAKDLFLEQKDKIIFLIFFVNYDSNFILGKIFLKKFFLTFNQESKIIGFYNNDLIIDNKSNKSYRIFGPFLIILCCGIGFYLAKKIYEQTRRRRVNELNDGFDYNIQNNDINNNNVENDIREDRERGIYLEMAAA